MSGRRHKRLYLLIEFSNSIFIKFYFKTYWCWLCIQDSLLGFFYFKLFICPPDVKRTKVFQGLYSLNPRNGSAMNPLQSLQHLETSDWILQYSKTQSSFKNGHKWNCLDKCLVRYKFQGLSHYQHGCTLLNQGNFICQVKHP